MASEVRCECDADGVAGTDVAPYVSGKRGREVFINGDVDYGVSSICCTS